MYLNMILETIAVVLGLAYLYFLIKENIICWYFGIASSIVSIGLFYRSGLYSESILYIYYVVIGVYGLWLWRKPKPDQNRLSVRQISSKMYLNIFLLGTLFTGVLGYYFKTYSDANEPYLDAGTTVFSFIASYLEANKFIDAWLFWIVINMATLVLYFNIDLNIYLLLTFLYLVFSFIGFSQWNRKLEEPMFVK
ncbi:nicotinamide riboside transporter PnuC [Reichenbachiella sp.]|uniref:nicotinamide riboside transporter PnuC n=1 Tax=Reichenbachiella sp. TaxID=2184521 RepID=UPI003B5C3434